MKFHHERLFNEPGDCAALRAVRACWWGLAWNEVLGPNVEN